MRSLKRNMQKIYYSLYIGVKPVLNEWDMPTGEYETEYDPPTMYMINVSPAKGEQSQRQFGESEKYDKVMVTADMNCPIVESSILWVDDLDLDKPHDYVVTKVAKSINSITYAISKVTISD